MRGIHFVAVCLWAVSVVAEIKIASKKIQGTNKSHAKSSPISKNSTLGAGGHKKNPKDQHSLGKVNTRSLFGRQECEPGFELCPELFCCLDGTVCCTDGCCDADTTCCVDGCCDADTVCCTDDYCCPDSLPYCVGDDYCCQDADQVACGDVDPTHCHDPDTTCCGDGVTCDESDTCCGTSGCCASGTNCCGDDACCSAEANDEDSQCCPGDENGPVCCGQYEVCCDGWCCYEGSTCDTEFGYCNVPEFGYAYNDSSTTRDFLRNACVGLQEQLDMGMPDTTANSQILTYAGPNNDNRQYNACGAGGCCTGQTVPAGDPSAGDPMSCEEYPFNSVEEGGASAQCSCISAYVNSAQGNQLQALYSGMHQGFKFLFYITNVDCTDFTTADLYPCNGS